MKPTERRLKRVQSRTRKVKHSSKKGTNEKDLVRKTNLSLMPEHSDPVSDHLPCGDGRCKHIHRIDPASEMNLPATNPQLGDVIVDPIVEIGHNMICTDIHCPFIAFNSVHQRRSLFPCGPSFRAGDVWSKRLGNLATETTR